MIGLIIFMSVIGVYYTFQNALSEEQSNLDDLMADAKQISNVLVSPGYPDPWNTTSVQRIGITDGTPRVSSTKLQQFGQMDYQTTRQLFHTPYEYAVYFRQGSMNVTLPNSQTFIGREPANATDVVITVRFVIYNSTLTQMEVRVWR